MTDLLLHFHESPGEAAPTAAGPLHVEANRPKLLRRLVAKPGSGIIALAISLLVHAALITFALVFCARNNHDEAPQLILSRGWATDFDDLTADTGAATIHPTVSFIDVPAPAPDVTAPAPRAAPAQVDVADPPAPPVELSEQQGTSQGAALVGLAADAAAPFNLNTPPGSSLADAATADRSTTDASASTGPPSSAASAVQAHGAGARSGVPDGLPIPNAHNKIPPYPAEASRRHWTGTVTLELRIDTDGRVTEATIVHSSGYEVLDRSARDTALTWQFSPARQDGRPTAVTVTRDINFIPRQ